MGFSRQECWSILSFPPPGVVLNPSVRRRRASAVRLPRVAVPLPACLLPGLRALLRAAPRLGHRVLRANSARPLRGAAASWRPRTVGLCAPGRPRWPRALVFQRQEGCLPFPEAGRALLPPLFQTLY